MLIGEIYHCYLVPSWVSPAIDMHLCLQPFFSHGALGRIHGSDDTVRVLSAKGLGVL